MLLVLEDVKIAFIRKRIADLSLAPQGVRHLVYAKLITIDSPTE